MTRKVLPYVALALLIVALAIAHNAMAQSTGELAPDAARLRWQNATELENGSPIPATGPESIVTNRVQRATCATWAFGPVQETLNVPASVNVLLFENLAPGCYRWRVRHVQENGGLSAWSAIVEKTIAEPPPPEPAKTKPPLTITIE